MRGVLFNRLSSNFLSSYKFCSVTESTLKIGDILQQRRIFTNEDVVEYSKVSQDSNPLHFDDEFAKTPGFQGRIVHGMLVASLFPQIISSHFVSNCKILPFKALLLLRLLFYFGTLLIRCLYC